MQYNFAKDPVRLLIRFYSHFRNMLSSQILSGARQLRSVARRNFGIAVPALQKVSDPIQQMFLDKIREYKTKSS